jgi:hypothetical protein
MTAREPHSTVARLLRQSRAYAGLAQALEGFPVELAGRPAPGHTHTAWEQLEHLRLAAEDLVRYCTDPDYRELGWPEGYWPSEPAPASPAQWHDSVERLLGAVEELARRVEDPEHDLYAAVPAAVKPEHHALRAALVLLDHNGYHAGQLIALRQALGAWPPGR